MSLSIDLFSLDRMPFNLALSRKAPSVSALVGVTIYVVET